ncbi:MAG: hypothetical protein Q7T61_21000 [Caulobacter sp.]|nr:hypothetical protein [Caulobacter sp.]
MTDHSKLFAFIARCESPADLKEMIRKGRLQNEQALADAAFNRLITIAPAANPGTLEHDFWRTVAAFEQLRTEYNGKTTLLSRTRQKVAKVGEQALLAEWARSKPTTGFEMLLEMRRPDLTGEAIVLRHPDRFTEAERAAATDRLVAAGVEVAGILELGAA